MSRVTQSRTFDKTPVLRQLLAHLVTRTISGQADQLKEYSLGVDVFARGASFDPRVDTIVRVQARRLRTKLAEYYDGEGRTDEVLIDLPKGHYVPTFRRAGNAASRSDVVEYGGGRRMASGWWGGLALGVLVGAALMFLLRGASHMAADTSAPTEIAAPADPAAQPAALRVRVAPFANQTGNPAHDAVGHRLAGQITAAIANLSGVTVADQPTAPTKNAAPDIAVVGTLYSDASTLEFQARLVDERTARLLYGFATRAASESDVGQALEALQQQIAGALAVHRDDFFGGLDAVSHPPTLEAYREYRAGLEIFQSDYARTLSHLKRAHELAPGFLTPLVVLVFTYGNLGQPEESEKIVAKMERLSDRFTAAERLVVEFLRANRQGRREQARRVLEELERMVPASLLVNHNLIELYVFANRPQAAVAAYMRQPADERLRHSVGSYRRVRFLSALHMIGDYERELQESRSAQAELPGVPLYALAEARALIGLGRLDELHEIVERSQSLSRTAGWIETPGAVIEQIAYELRAHGHPEESRATAVKAIEWYNARRAESARQLLYREGLARALSLAGRWPEAAEIFEALAAEDSANFEYLAKAGETAAHMGNVRRARIVLAELERTTRPSDRGWRTYARAMIVAALGERDRALQLLRDAFAEGLPHGPHLHQEVSFEILNGYEPYQRLLRPVG
jgi:tetratricopeptide (TPR) repeat protein